MTVETLDLDDPRPTEIVVEIAGSGICHTDLSVRDGAWPYPLPAVLGHEGAGTVMAIGSAVDAVSVGDRVVLSFGFCGSCPGCLSGNPASCPDAPMINLRGTRADGSVTLSHDGAPVHGLFNSQSSFATHLLTEQRFATRLPDGIPLELAGTLGCGIPTGAGAVLNVLASRPGSTVAIIGLGAVGLAAVAAARFSGCSRIIGVDLNPGRFELARAFGATDVIDAGRDDTVATIHQLVAGGVDGAIEASGAKPALNNAFLSTKPTGTTVLVGAAPIGTHYEIDSVALLSGRTLRGCTMGSANPRVLIPQLARMWQQGLLPIEKMSTTFKLSAIEQALAAAADGSVVKPVLIP
ncbi:NAD(P)-dependent alcohol dehydrogenase [[Mycobacterium] vasticus]|uniref:NAD(P)-dependent alcohol dehydrogenase n=1 Tax=[Mycobacterium] vasticus TaxID=2875777 RepID=A0ABU5Z2Q6_9MYCO|nr:NAD(P)-dependent alcohol dehydrogenase [Mycolicibacter sp. MYC017]MEB3071680.1 NAD(P)-dependent alcohol dehydrogenase [Mycolicibacter sp. MYC017]